MRLRQLAAHEIGHTLGLAHNYVASTHDQASVMGLSAPVDRLERMMATLPTWRKLMPAAHRHLGTKVAIRYGYTQFAPGADQKRRPISQIILDCRAMQGNMFSFPIADHSGPLGSAHPRAHLWDNGPNAVDELARLLKKFVRRRWSILAKTNSIPDGYAVVCDLDETLVPLYFLHRYQTEAAAKALGGVDYAYALRGDGQMVTEIVPAAEQKRALQLLLLTVSPATLTLPERIVKLIPPHPPGYERTRESFPEQTGLTFDPIAAAQAAAGLTGSLLFHPERAARLVEHHARNAANPTLVDVLRQIAVAASLG